VCDSTGIGGVASCDADTCTFVCTGSGDGVLQTLSIDGQPPEDCDEGPDVSRQTAPRLCSELDPWRTELPNASGTATFCTARCLYDRSPCSYCANDSAPQDSWPLAPDLAGQGATSFPEAGC